MRGSVNIRFRATTGDLASDINKINQAIAQQTSQIVRLSLQTGAGLRDVQTAVQTAAAATVQANRQIMREISQGMQTTSNIMASAVNVASVSYKSVSGMAVEMTRKIAREVGLFSDLIGSAGREVAEQITASLTGLGSETRRALEETLQPILEVFRAEKAIPAAQFIDLYGQQLAQAMAIARSEYEKVSRRILEYEANLDSLTDEERQHLEQLKAQRDTLLALETRFETLRQSIIKETGGIRVLIEQTEYSAAAMQRAQAAVARFAQSLGEIGVRAAGIQEVGRRIAYLEEQLQRFPEMLAEEWMKELQYAFEELGPGMARAFAEIQQQFMVLLERDPELRAAPFRWFEAFSKEFGLRFQQFASTAFRGLQPLWDQLEQNLMGTRIWDRVMPEWRQRFQQLFKLTAEEAALPVEEQMSLLYGRFKELDAFLEQIEISEKVVPRKAIDAARALRGELRNILNVERANIETVKKMSMFYIDAAKSLDNLRSGLRRLTELQAIAQQFKTLAARIDQAQVSTLDLYKVTIKARNELARFGPASEPAVIQLNEIARHLKSLLQQRQLAEKLGSIAETILGTDARKVFRNLNSFKAHLNDIADAYERLYAQHQEAVAMGKARPLPGFEQLVESLRAWREEWMSAKSFEGVRKVLEQMHGYLRSTAPQQLSKEFHRLATSIETVPIRRVNQIANALAAMRKGASAKEMLSFANAVAKLGNMATATEGDFEKLLRTLDQLRVRVTNMTTGTQSLAQRFDKLRAYASRLISGFSELDRFMTKILIRVGVLQSVRFMLLDVARAINAVWQGIDQLKDMRTTIANFKALAIAAGSAVPDLKRLAEATGNAVSALRAAQLIRPLMLFGIEPRLMERLFAVIRATMPRAAKPEEIERRIEEVINTLVSGSESAIEQLTEQFGVAFEATDSLEERIRKLVEVLESATGYTSRYGAAVGQLGAIQKEVASAIQLGVSGFKSLVSPLKAVEQVERRLTVGKIARWAREFSVVAGRAVPYIWLDLSKDADKVREALEDLMPAIMELQRTGAIPVKWWRTTYPQLKSQWTELSDLAFVLTHQISGQLLEFETRLRAQGKALPEWYKEILKSEDGLGGFSRRLARLLILADKLEAWDPLGPIVGRVLEINKAFAKMIPTWESSFREAVEQYEKIFKARLIPATRERLKMMEDLGEEEKASIFRAVELHARMLALERALKELRPEIEKVIKDWEQMIPPDLQGEAVETFRALKREVNIMFQGFESDLERAKVDWMKATETVSQKIKRTIEQTQKDTAAEIKNRLDALKLKYTDTMLGLEMSTSESLERILAAYHELITEIKPLLTEDLGDALTDMQERVKATAESLHRDLLNTLRSYISEVTDEMEDSASTWSSAISEAMSIAVSRGLEGIDELLLSLREEGKDEIAAFLSSIKAESTTTSEFIAKLARQSVSKIESAALKPLVSGAEQMLKTFGQRQKEFQQDFAQAIALISDASAETLESVAERIERARRTAMLRLRKEIQNIERDIAKLSDTSVKNIENAIKQLDELRLRARELGAEEKLLNRIEGIRVELLAKQTRAVKELAEAEFRRISALATLRAQLQALERLRIEVESIEDERERARLLERINASEKELFNRRIAGITKLSTMMRQIDLLTIIKDLPTRIDAANTVLEKLAEILSADFAKQFEQLGEVSETEAERIAGNVTNIMLEASTAIGQIMDALTGAFAENAEVLEQFRARLDEVLTRLDEKADETKLRLLEVAAEDLYTRGVNIAADIVGGKLVKSFLKADQAVTQFLKELEALERETGELTPGLDMLRKWFTQQSVEGKTAAEMYRNLQLELNRFAAAMNARDFQTGARAFENIMVYMTAIRSSAAQFAEQQRRLGNIELANLLLESNRYELAALTLRTFKEWLDTYSELDARSKAWLTGLISVSGIAGDLASVFEIIAQIEGKTTSRTALWLKVLSLVLKNTDNIYKSFYRGIRLLNALKRGQSALKDIAEQFKLISETTEGLRLEASWTAFANIATGITGILSAGVALWQLYENYRKASKRAEEEAQRERERKLEEWQRKIEEATGWMESSIAEAIREGWDKGFETVDLSKLILLKFQEQIADVFAEAIFTSLGRDRFTRLLERYASLATAAARGHVQAIARLEELQPRLLEEVNNLASAAQSAYTALLPFMRSWAGVFSSLRPGAGGFGYVPYWPGGGAEVNWAALQPPETVQEAGAFAAPQLMIMPAQEPTSGLALAEMTDSLRLIASNTTEMVSILRRVEGKLTVPGQVESRVIIEKPNELNESYSGRI